MVPPEVAVHLSRAGITPGPALGRGASCTRLFGGTGPSGEKLVVKVLRRGAALVDGHDDASFRRKYRQLSYLSRRYPLAAAYHVPIRSQIVTPGWAAHVLPFVPGHDLLQPARAGQPDVRSVADTVRGMVSSLTVAGYRFPRRTGAGYLAEAHVRRIRRRLPLLATVASPQAIEDHVVVNGATCLGLLPLLEQAGRYAGLLDPGWLSPPVHGDLNTRNVLVTRFGSEPEFALIDPRGTTRPVDVVYDLAKLLFSASLWDATLRSGLLVASSRSGVSVRVGAGAPAAYPRVAQAMACAFGSCEPLGSLPVMGPAWRARLAFSHAVHAVAEAACRLSDAWTTGEAPGGGPALDSALPAARGLFHAGLVLLDDVIRRLSARRPPEEFDLEAHLGLLGDFYQGGPAAAGPGAVGGAGAPAPTVARVCGG